MRSFHAYLLTATLTFLGVGFALSMQHVPTESLWVATPTAFPPVLGTIAISSSNASQVEQLAVLRMGSVTSVTFSPDGNLLAFNGGETTVDIFSMRTGRAAKIFRENTGYASKVAFSPDGTGLVVANRDGTLHLWNIASGEEVGVIQGYSGELSSLAYSPNGMLLASASGIPDFTVRVWDVVTHTQIRVLRGEQDEEFFDVAFSPDGTTLAAATGSITYGKVRLWDVETWTPVVTFEDFPELVSSITFSHDGTLLATGSYDGTIRLWEVGTSQAPAILQRFDTVVHSIDFSADDTLLAIGLDDNTIQLWNLSKQEAISLEGHTGPVWSVVFSPDSRLLASGSMYHDETVRLWGIS